LTSTSSGWLTAKATVRANESAGIAEAFIEFSNSVGGFRIGHAVGQFRRYGARRDLIGSAAAMPYSTPLQIHIDHPLPFVDLQPLEQPCGIRPALLIITSTRP
jgi:hypothetical protein